MCREKISKDIEGLRNIVNNLDFIDIYDTLHQKPSECRSLNAGQCVHKTVISIISKSQKKL